MGANPKLVLTPPPIFVEIGLITLLLELDLEVEGAFKTLDYWFRAVFGTFVLDFLAAASFLEELDFSEWMLPEGLCTANGFLVETLLRILEKNPFLAPISLESCSLDARGIVICFSIFPMLIVFLDFLWGVFADELLLWLALELLLLED